MRKEDLKPGDIKRVYTADGANYLALIFDIPNTGNLFTPFLSAYLRNDLYIGVTTIALDDIVLVRSIKLSFAERQAYRELYRSYVASLNTYHNNTTEMKRYLTLSEQYNKEHSVLTQEDKKNLEELNKLSHTFKEYESFRSKLKEFTEEQIIGSMTNKEFVNYIQKGLGLTRLYSLNKNKDNYISVRCWNRKYYLVFSHTLNLNITTLAELKGLGLLDSSATEEYTRIGLKINEQSGGFIYKDMDRLKDNMHVYKWIKQARFAENYLNEKNITVKYDIHDEFINSDSIKVYIVEEASIELTEAVSKDYADVLINSLRLGDK